MIGYDPAKAMAIAKQYKELEIGYDEAMQKLTDLGLTDDEADMLLIPRKKLSQD